MSRLLIFQSLESFSAFLDVSPLFSFFLLVISPNKLKECNPPFHLQSIKGPKVSGLGDISRVFLLPSLSLSLSLCFFLSLAFFGSVLCLAFSSSYDHLILLLLLPTTTTYLLLLPTYYYYLPTTTTYLLHYHRSTVVAH